MSLLVKFNLILILCFGIALVPAQLITRNLLEQNARRQIEQQARLMLQTALATRGYTNKQIKPLLAPRLADEFLPQSVPAYSATEIFNSLRDTHPEYTYKEATLNPTNPRDRVVEWEADVVNVFRNDEKRTEIINTRDTPLGPSLYLARPIKITDQGCLSCHTTPELAPASVVKLYGPSGGYGWKMNEIIGAQVVSVPESLPLSLAERQFRTMMFWFAAIGAAVMLVLNLLLLFVVVRPIAAMSATADAISRGELGVPELPVKGKDEISALADSFNRMHRSLRKAMKLLDE